MKTFAKVFALGCFALCGAFAAQAQSASLTCDDSSLSPLFTIPINGLFVDTAIGTQRFFSVTTTLDQFNFLGYLEYFSSNYSFCQFSPSNGTGFYDVNIADVTASVNGSEQVVTMTLSYGIIQLGPSKVSPSLKTPLTEEEKRKALTDYLTRLPKAVAPTTKQ